MLAKQSVRVALVNDYEIVLAGIAKMLEPYPQIRIVDMAAQREPVRVAEVTAAALERGVWVRPFRDLVYTMPPYVTADGDLGIVTRALVGAVEDVHG